MTQTLDIPDVLNRLDRMTTAIESIQTDTRDIKITLARMDERLNAVDGRLDRLEKCVDSQDIRLWGFVVALFIAFVGFLAKLAFFPGGQA